jgi:hypothetical protein
MATHDGDFGEEKSGRENANCHMTSAMRSTQSLNAVKARNKLDN